MPPSAFLQLRLAAPSSSTQNYTSFLHRRSSSAGYTIGLPVGLILAALLIVLAAFYLRRRTAMKRRRLQTLRSRTPRTDDQVFFAPDHHSSTIRGVARGIRHTVSATATTSLTGIRRAVAGGSRILTQASSRGRHHERSHGGGQDREEHEMPNYPARLPVHPQPTANYQSQTLSVSAGSDRRHGYTESEDKEIEYQATQEKPLPHNRHAIVGDNLSDIHPLYRGAVEPVRNQETSQQTNLHINTNVGANAGIGRSQRSSPHTHTPPPKSRTPQRFSNELRSSLTPLPEHPSRESSPIHPTLPEHREIIDRLHMFGIAGPSQSPRPREQTPISTIREGQAESRYLQSQQQSPFRLSFPSPPLSPSLESSQRATPTVPASPRRPRRDNNLQSRSGNQAQDSDNWSPVFPTIEEDGTLSDPRPDGPFPPRRTSLTHGFEAVGGEGTSGPRESEQANVKSFRSFKRHVDAAAERCIPGQSQRPRTTRASQDASPTPISPRDLAPALFRDEDDAESTDAFTNPSLAPKPLVIRKTSGTPRMPLRSQSLIQRREATGSSTYSESQFDDGHGRAGFAARWAGSLESMLNPSLFFDTEQQIDRADQSLSLPPPVPAKSPLRPSSPLPPPIPPKSPLRQYLPSTAPPPRRPKNPKRQYSSRSAGGTGDNIDRPAGGTGGPSHATEESGNLRLPVQTPSPLAQSEAGESDESVVAPSVVYEEGMAPYKPDDDYHAFLRKIHGDVRAPSPCAARTIPPVVLSPARSAAPLPEQPGATVRISAENATLLPRSQDKGKGKEVDRSAIAAGAGPSQPRVLPELAHLSRAVPPPTMPPLPEHLEDDDDDFGGRDQDSLAQSTWENDVLAGYSSAPPTSHYEASPRRVPSADNVETGEGSGSGSGTGNGKGKGKGKEKETALEEGPRGRSRFDVEGAGVVSGIGEEDDGVTVLPSTVYVPSRQHGGDETRRAEEEEDEEERRRREESGEGTAWGWI